MKQPTNPRRVGLIGCVSGKLNHPAKAMDLYSSPLFHGRRRYVEKSCSEWFILSAKHHVVNPELIVAPYNESLIGKSTEVKRDWARQVLREIDDVLGSDLGEVEIEIHAGADYRDFGLSEGLRKRGAKVSNPVEGLGIGRQLQFYSGDQRGSFKGAETNMPTRHGSGLYTSLGIYLAARLERITSVSFSEIESMIGRPLPKSARTYRAWWSNDRSHSHAHAWMDEGWKVDDVNFPAERVAFVRVR